MVEVLGVWSREGGDVSRGIHAGYMRDTFMRYMYLQRFEDTWRIYMRDTLGIHNEMYVSQIVSREVRICK
jgi:hypothetical protein